MDRISRTAARMLTAAVALFAGTAFAQNWVQLPGAGNDIGVGANGTVWVIGTNAEAGGYGIYRMNASRNWDKIPGSAVRIDVDP